MKTPFYYEKKNKGFLDPVTDFLLPILISMDKLTDNASAVSKAKKTLTFTSPSAERHQWGGAVDSPPVGKIPTTLVGGLSM